MAKSITTRTTRRLRTGSSSSSQMDLFLPGMSTLVQSKTSPRVTSTAIDSATSSPASGAGHSLPSKLDGHPTASYGQDRVRVNLSARQATEEGLLMKGTSGPSGTGSSNSAALQRSLESRLRARMQILGSSLYKLTWKDWTMPSGPRRFRLQASARPRSETAYTGWPTPRLGKSGGRGKASRAKQGRIEDVAQTTPYPIPGDTRSGLFAPMDDIVPLNPNLSRWLMGYPPEWTSSGVTAMQSASRRRESFSPYIQFLTFSPTGTTKNWLARERRRRGINTRARFPLIWPPNF